MLPAGEVTRVLWLGTVVMSVTSRVRASTLPTVEISGLSRVYAFSIVM